MGEFIEVVPPQQRIDEHWYQGTADAVYQNIYTIEKERPKYVVILAGDHIYKMNYAKLVERHIESGADLTVGTLPVGVQAAAGQFGVVEVDADSRVVGFEEKPSHPKSIPGDPHRALASMGIYVVVRPLPLRAALPRRHAARQPPRFRPRHHPGLVESHRVFAYPFMDENRKKEAYWRDVGTLDAYYDANMDLISVDPQLNMYDCGVADPHVSAEPAAAEVRVCREGPRRAGAERRWTASSARAASSRAANWSGRSSAPTRRINSYAQVADSILFEGVNVGRHAKIRRAIIDKGVHIPAGIEIGYDHDLDRSRGFTVTEAGVTVIAKTHGVEHFMEKPKA